MTMKSARSRGQVGRQSIYKKALHSESSESSSEKRKKKISWLSYIAHVNRKAVD